VNRLLTSTAQVCSSTVPSSRSTWIRTLPADADLLAISAYISVEPGPPDSASTSAYFVHVATVPADAWPSRQFPVLAHPRRALHDDRYVVGRQCVGKSG
jgi:hypothetical protein